MRHGKSGIIARPDPARTDRVTPRSPSVPDVTHDEPRLLACPANERLRHAHPDAEMSIMAAPFETGGTPTAVTDGGGMAGMQRVSNPPVLSNLITQAGQIYLSRARVMGKLGFPGATFKHRLRLNECTQD